MPPLQYLKNTETFKIHAGYLGFLREINFMYQNNISFHTTLHRATYLIKILDSFAAELPLIRG